MTQWRKRHALLMATCLTALTIGTATAQQDQFAPLRQAPAQLQELFRDVPERRLDLQDAVREVAETRVAQVLHKARDAGHPLQCTIRNIRFRKHRQHKVDFPCFDQLGKIVSNGGTQQTLHGHTFFSRPPFRIGTVSR